MNAITVIYLSAQCTMKETETVMLIFKENIQHMKDDVFFTILAGELGLNGFKSSFFSDNLLAGASGLSFLYGFSSKYSFGAMLRRNAPLLVSFR